MPRRGGCYCIPCALPFPRRLPPHYPLQPALSPTALHPGLRPAVLNVMWFERITSGLLRAIGVVKSKPKSAVAQNDLVDEVNKKDE